MGANGISEQIIGAPAFFPTVWGWIKRWFDPITTSKIFILSHHDLLPTLEAFIEPANIPKKYGGQLDYTFGDKPVLDPAMAKVLTFEDGRKEFPRGPMFWINNGKKGEEEKGFDMEAIAVGAEGGKERREKVCRIETRFPETTTEMNGHADPVAIRKEMLTAPTETDLPSTLQSEAPSSQPKTSKTEEEGKPEVNGEQPVVQEGKLIPASRPEPVTFITATEGVDTLNEKTGNLTLNGNGEANGPHQTKTANLLDPAVTVNKNVATENAHVHHEAGGKVDAVGGGVEEADKAQMSENHDRGLVEKVKEQVEISA
jgi:hypothetical protein